MEKQKNRIKVHYFGLLLACLLFLCGILATVKINRSNRELLIQQQEETLLEVVKATDQNLFNITNRIQNELFYLTANEDFKNAEETFLRNGRNYDLWYLMRSNMMNQNDLISAMILMVGDEVFISSHQAFEGEYEFYQSLGRRRVSLCKGPEDKYYLAFGFSGYNKNLNYYALMDLQTLYRQINDENSTTINHFVLYNEKLNILIRSSGNNINVLRLNETDGERVSVSDNLTTGRILAGHIQNPENPSGEPFAEVIREDGTNEAQQSYLAVVPIDASKNGIFDVALMTDFDRMVGKFTALNYELMGSYALMGIGLLLFFATIGYMRLLQVRSDRMLEELEAKNKAAEELLEKTKQLEHVQRLELLGTMTSGISHEFNNLLTPIMGYSIMSLEMIPEDNEALAENIIEVYNASKKAKDIVRQLSELSRKNTSATLGNIHADTLVKKAIRMAGPAKPKTVTVETAFHADDHVFLGNETQMTQVLLNIMINAYHAMEAQESGHLRIRTRLNTVGHEIVIAISDNGCGIPEDVLPHIFDPFYTTKETGKGTGLGLAIVKKVIEEDLGGRIDINSAPESGTTVRLYLKDCTPMVPEEEA